MRTHKMSLCDNEIPQKLTGTIQLDHKAIWATIKTVLRLGVEGHPD